MINPYQYLMQDSPTGFIAPNLEISCISDSQQQKIYLTHRIFYCLADVPSLTQAKSQTNCRLCSSLFNRRYKTRIGSPHLLQTYQTIVLIVFPICRLDDLVRVMYLPSTSPFVSVSSRYSTWANLQLKTKRIFNYGFNAGYNSRS